MYIYKLGENHDKKTLLKTLGVESGGINIISKKMKLHYYLITDLGAPAANILKQDALSIGAELAVPRGVVTCEGELFRCLFIGNQKLIEILASKELSQPFGLQTVAKELARVRPNQIPSQTLHHAYARHSTDYAKKP